MRLGVSSKATYALERKRLRVSPVSGITHTPGESPSFVKNASFERVGEIVGWRAPVFVSGSSRGDCETRTAVISVTSCEKTSMSFSQATNPFFKIRRVYVPGVRLEIAPFVAVLSSPLRYTFAPSGLDLTLLMP